MPSAQITDMLQDAVALHRRGAIDDAASRYAAVLRADPANADAHYYLGLLACQRGRFADGAQCARQSLAADPQHARAHILLGRALSALGQSNEALASFDRAIAVAPELAEAHSHRGNVLSELGRHAEATASYDRAVAMAPGSIGDWFDRGVALGAVDRHGDAIASFDKAIAGKPDFAEAHLCRAMALFDLRRPGEALAGVDRALQLRPDLVEGWLGRGNILLTLKRYDEALGAYDKALALDGDETLAWLGRGNLLTALKRHDAASRDFDKALALKPDLAEAWLGRGNIFVDLGRFEDAASAYDRALALKPDLAEAWLGRGNVWAELTRFDDAARAFDRALELKPDLAQAWLGRGNVNTEFKRHDDAYAAYDKAVALMPNLHHAAGSRLNAKLLLCDWTNLERETAELLAMVRAQQPVSNPHFLLALSSSAADQLQCARRFIQDMPAFPAVWRGEVYAHDRIRIAYLSADFHEHPVAHLIAGLIEHHDRARFETTAISFGPDQTSPMRQRLKRAFEHFVDVGEQSDAAVAELMRRREIDIAVDLMGFTAHNRLGVLARRPAPVQVNYLGYAATMGARFIDYIIANPTIIPEDQCEFYDEQVVWLPESYFVNDNRRKVAERTPTRSECGLPENAFVFCCFNNPLKIAPDMFAVWMRLLRAAGDSVLWLSEANTTARANLRGAAQHHGIAAERLIFAAKVPELADHLARQHNADLFLDTLPYNAHTTACDALWVGLPVVTCIGTTFAGRVAASLLQAVGLDELVTHSLADYEALAQKLASEPASLAAIKAKLLRNRDSFPLFDTARTTRHMEAAYATMWERYQRGEMPRSVGAKPLRIA